MAQETAYQKVNIVDADGNLVSFSGDGGGGGSNASADKQDEQTALLTTIDSNVTTISSALADVAIATKQDEQTGILSLIQDDTSSLTELSEIKNIAIYINSDTANIASQTGIISEKLDDVLTALDNPATETTLLQVRDRLPVSAQLTPAYNSVSNSGTVSAGKTAIAVFNFGANAGTLNGVSFPSGARVGWEATGNNTLAAVTYDATGTTFLISTLG
ncbi:hypothetical protein [Dendronalium sp. ChiSLP03b]|uniref:hypothetical protein n=1 Tax=Dendronalium sp. ChiSLP03b TaxID=3075381 RepID=UPI00391BB7D5